MPADRAQYVIGIDIGGTCTDCVVIDGDGRVTLSKVFSTPPDFSNGILDVLSAAAQGRGLSRERLLAEARLFLHSATVAENAVVDGTLAPAGLITTRGFELTLPAMRGGYGRWSGLTEAERRDTPFTDKPAPLIDGSLIRGVRERVDAKGNVVARCDPDEVERAVRDLVERGIDALGVSLLWSFVNPANEQEIKAIIARLAPGLFVTVSHEIAPIVGEYERTATVALNARLGPVIRRYLHGLRSRLEAEGFAGTLLVMQAYGGLLPVERASQMPVGMIESGPVSGLVGSQHLGEQLGVRNIVAADMGGTTFKVGVVRDGLVEYQREPMVQRYHYALPKMDVVSLGLAGGSIISIEPRTGLPQVGPGSAGSYPGPVCYDHGGDRPTVTDVDAVLGYLNASFFLGGQAKLDIARAASVFEEQIAGPLGRPVIEAAAGIYALVNSMIYDLLHKTTVQRGLDPRGFALFSFGGTAGMHAAAYGEELGFSHIVIPHSASVHCAYGLIASDIVHEEQTTHPMRAPGDLAAIDELFGAMVGRGVAQLRAEGFAGDDIRVHYSIDTRYRRQTHVLTVPMVRGDGPLTPAELEATLARFESLYQEKYGRESAYREAGIELVSFRVRCIGLVRRPPLSTYERSGHSPAHALVERRQAWVHKERAWREVEGYDFERLAPDNRIPGPAIVWTPITTVVFGPGQLATVDAYKNLVITTEARG